MCRGELSAVIAQLSVCEAAGSGSEELKKRPHPSPAVLRFVNVRERKPRKKTKNKTKQKRIYFFSFSIYKWHIIVQTNRQNKTSIQIFQTFLTNKAPLALIFFRGLHITCKTYYNLSIKGENYQLD